MNIKRLFKIVITKLLYVICGIYQDYIVMIVYYLYNNHELQYHALEIDKDSRTYR